ncbi:MAG: calcium:sodium antiporter [Calditrichaeota bacterium]|nr:MAG: calcium:sodium antiporter [Calditrichota bacterium]
MDLIVLEKLSLLILGLLMLWGGAELLVRYTSLLARSMGVSPIILGLTIVSVGTSIPELVVSIIAALEGQVGIALGNIVGSNIANLGLILGVGALIISLEIKRSWILPEVGIMIAVTLVFWMLAETGDKVVQAEGLLLLVMMGGFLIYIARNTLEEMAEYREMVAENGENGIRQISTARKWGYLGLSIVGIAVLITGSKIAVSAGTRLAEILNVTNTVIGLTLIAVGTSLPELITTIVSAIRKENDLAIGNIIGSNIFNITLIGGVTATLHPIPVTEDPKLMIYEMPLMIFLSFLTLAVLWIRSSRRNLHVVKGVLLLSMYVLFLFLTVSR